MKKNLVAFFSASGTTAKVATKLAEVADADLFEIVPCVPYTSADLNWNDENSRSTKEMKDISSRPEISSHVSDMANYERIYVGFPIWWYVAPTIINTFLEQYDLSGKTIIPFATSGGSGMGESNMQLQVSCKNSKLLTGHRFNSSVSKEELKEWVDSIK